MFGVTFHSLFSKLPLHKFEMPCPGSLDWLSLRWISVQLIEHGLGDGQLTRNKTKMIQYLQQKGSVRHRMYNTISSELAIHKPYHI